MGRMGIGAFGGGQAARGVVRELGSVQWCRLRRSNAVVYVAGALRDADACGTALSLSTMVLGFKMAARIMRKSRRD